MAAGVVVRPSPGARDRARSPEWPGYRTPNHWYRSVGGDGPPCLLTGLRHPEPLRLDLCHKVFEIWLRLLPLLAVLCDSFLRRWPMWLRNHTGLVGLVRYGLQLRGDQRNPQWRCPRRLHLPLQLLVEAA